MRFLAFALALLAAGAPAASPAPSTIEITARDFARAEVVSPGGADKARRDNDLAGTAGWYDYDVDIPADGWYELVLAGHAATVEVFIDPRGDDPARARHYVTASYGFDGRTDKIGNFWLARGRHVVRLQRYFWTGFPRLTGLELRPSNGSLATSARVDRGMAHGIYRASQCEPLSIEYGPRAAAATLRVSWVNTVTSRGIRSYAVTLPATAKPSRIEWAIPCDDPGFFVLYFDGGETREKITNRDLHPFVYEVIDTAARSHGPAELRRTLVHDIDVVAKPPDYAGGETRVVQRAFGAYRESGDSGWLEFQRSRLRPADFSWFAYTLEGVSPQEPHIVEVDYPDDADRTFAIALRESAPVSYPVAGGVDSGGEFVPSQRIETHALLFWPNAPHPRLVFMNARNGKRAAAARIRVYRVEGPLPPLVPPQRQGRRFANWYEEGSNVLGIFGAPDTGYRGSHLALERWAQAVAYMGGDALWPTVAVYSFALYPSRYHRSFSQPWSHDMLRQALLIAERHRLKVIPELHPRADELSWAYARAPSPKPHLLASRNGETRDDLPPFHNPLHPHNRSWYLGMIGELADRYAAFPALDGVSLRFMHWKNPALHNFHSLDWGYDDLTVAEFEKDTGLRIPVEGGEGRFRARHRWLMSNAREQWIDWRCRRIADLVARIRDRVRQARPDLKVYIPVFGMTEGGDRYHSGTAWLREAGLDPERLGRIDGVVLVNALHSYGRRADAATHELLRSQLTDTARVRQLAVPGKGNAYLPNANYFEATEIIVPPESLGFPATTKKTWMSAVVNPAGRSALERYALLLAAGDATLLGDGGNAYTLGQPLLREFLAEYRRLPATPFRTVGDADGPVVVRELERGRDYYFYAVNRSPRPVTLRLAFSGAGTLTRLATGASSAPKGGLLQIELAPFQLVGWMTTDTLRIARATH